MQPIASNKKLVNGEQLLAELFDESCRPTKRWLAYQTKARAIPRIKIGALVFFDVEQVRAKLAEKNTIRAK
jgi:hypothetical protein